MKVSYAFHCLLLLNTIVSMQQRPPIFDAVIQGNLQTIKEFILSGESIDLVDKNTGQSLLHYAVKNNKKEIVLYLLEQDADPDGHSVLCRPLWDACRLNLYDIAQLLLEFGANMNIKDPIGTTVLMRTAFYQHCSVAELLLQYGADSAIQDKFKKTVLEIAQEQNNTQLVALLQPENVKLLQSTYRKYTREQRLHITQTLYEERQNLELTRLRNFITINPELTQKTLTYLQDKAKSLQAAATE